MIVGPSIAGFNSLQLDYYETIKIIFITIYINLLLRVIEQICWNRMRKKNCKKIEDIDILSEHYFTKNVRRQSEEVIIKKIISIRIYYRLIKVQN